MHKTYKSKISYVLLLVILLVLFIPVIANVVTSSFTILKVALVLITSLFYGLVLYLFFNTDYTIDGTSLRIRCGFIKYKAVDIMSIKEVAKSSNIISSPAASFDRIEVKYGQFDEIILSPIDKQAFAEHLKSINPNILIKLNS